MRENSIRKTFLVNIQGVSISFSTDDFYSKLWLYLAFGNNRVHEGNVINLMIEKINTSRCFVDVGANLGYYTILASKLMPDGIVYAFEMDEYNYNLLNKNLNINRCKNINIYHAAVTDFSGVINYKNNLRRPNPTLSMSTDNSKPKFGRIKSVQAVSLDDFFKDKRWIPEVIKIDVEGAEMKVLNGMQNILENSKIQLFLEIHPMRLKLKFQSSTNEVVSNLIDKVKMDQLGNYGILGFDISYFKDREWISYLIVDPYYLFEIIGSK